MKYKVGDFVKFNMVSLYDGSCVPDGYKDYVFPSHFKKHGTTRISEEYNITGAEILWIDKDNTHACLKVPVKTGTPPYLQLGWDTSTFSIWKKVITNWREEMSE